MSDLTPAAADLAARSVGPHAALPIGPDGVRWRRAHADDAEQIHAVATAAGAVDHPYFSVPLDEVIDDLASLADDGAGDAVVAVDATDRVVAYGMVLPFALDSTPRTALLIGAVEPASRGLGIGRRLAARQRSRGHRWLEGEYPPDPLRLLAFVDEDARAQRSTLEHAGFAAMRQYLHLRRPVTSEPAASLAAGYAIVPFDATVGEPVRRLRNAAFAGQWGGHSLDEDAWARFVERSVFDAGLSRAVVDGDGAVVGYTLIEVDAAENAAQGTSDAYLASLGVDEAHRGRGLASALLTDLIERSRQRGLTRVVLDVDAESESRATALYERLGFRTAHRRLGYTVEFAPGGADDAIRP